MTLKEIKERIGATIYPNGNGEITAEKHRQLLYEMADFAAEGSVRPDGYYPQMSVGVADNLVGKDDIADRHIAFDMTAGKNTSVLDGDARVMSIKGSSVVWNQILTKTSWAGVGGELVYSGGVYTLTPDGTNQYSGISQVLPDEVCVPSNKYCILYDVYFEGSTNVGYNFMRKSSYETREAGKWHTMATFFVADTMVNSNAILFVRGTPSVIKYRDNILCINLTKMFGAGNEPTTLAELLQRIPQGVELTGYNAGTLIHCCAEGVKTVGFNAFNGVWEDGSISDTGEETSSISSIRTGYIPIIPGAGYYVSIQGKGKVGMRSRFYDAQRNIIGTTAAGGAGVESNAAFVAPSNAHYVRFTPTVLNVSKSDKVCLHLTHSGYRNGEYEPYWEEMQPLPICEYFPQGMKSAGLVCDEIYYDKYAQKWYVAQRVGVRVYSTGDENVAGLLTDKVSTVHPLAEPIVTELPGTLNLVYRVSDFGTEETISDAKTAPLHLGVVYGFNAPDNLRMLLNRVAELEAMVSVMAAAMIATTAAPDIEE